VEAMGRRRVPVLALAVAALLVGISGTDRAVESSARRAPISTARFRALLRPFQGRAGDTRGADAAGMTPARET
jgi:hypothetical protein